MKTKETFPMQQQVARIIQTTRVQRGWSETKLAENAGMSRHTVRRIEQCEYNPRFDLLYRLLKALDLPVTINGEEIC